MPDMLQRAVRVGGGGGGIVVLCVTVIRQFDARPHQIASLLPADLQRAGA